MSRIAAIACLFIAILLPSMGFAQKEPRQILHGRVVADSLPTHDVTVRNLTSKIRAITDENGGFTLYARPTDTLYFESITFHPVSLILKEEHFRLKQLVVKLDAQVTMLDEVVIHPAVLVGDLSTDSGNTKTMQATSGFDARQLILTAPPKPQSPLNEKRYPNESVLKGVDFVKIYDMIFHKRRKKDRGEIYGAAPRKTFPEAVKERFTYHFFTETLKIPKDEIGLFIVFCDKGDETRKLLAPDKEFELTDYLVTKSVEYLKKDE